MVHVGRTEIELGDTMMGGLYPAGSVSKMLSSKQSAIICMYIYIYIYIYCKFHFRRCVLPTSRPSLPPSTFWCIGKNNVG